MRYSKSVNAYTNSSPLTSVSAERPFLKLKIIKNRLRTTMKQDCLQSLMLKSIESDICQNLDVDRLVKLFRDSAPWQWNLY